MSSRESKIANDSSSRCDSQRGKRRERETREVARMEYTAAAAAVSKRDRKS